MPITASGLFYPTWRDALNGTIVLNLDLETHRVAMFQNSITPNFSSDTAYGVAPYNAGEVSGTNYVAGGELLTGTALADNPAGTIEWDANNVQWDSSTITDARGCLIYADALAGNNAIVFVNFGEDYDTVNGTFKIQWEGAGILKLDLTP